MVGLVLIIITQVLERKVYFGFNHLIQYFDSDGNFTYEQDAMTDHEVIAWKMDEQNAAIMSIQSTQMWNNINSGGNYQRNINQQNLNNMWWDY